jgi:hypothetical protein
MDILIAKANGHIEGLTVHLVRSRKQELKEEQDLPGVTQEAVVELRPEPEFLASSSLVSSC